MYKNKNMVFFFDESFHSRKINKKTIEDKELLKDRWNGFSINIAYFIHSSTDVAILTLFTSLSTVSI